MLPSSALSEPATVRRPRGRPRSATSPLPGTSAARVRAHRERPRQSHEHPQSPSGEPATPTATGPLRPATSAARMRAHRQRQRSRTVASPPVTTTTPVATGLGRSFELVAAERRRRTRAQVRPQAAARGGGWWDWIIRSTGAITTIRLRWSLVPCRHCGALLLMEESSDWCCGDGSRLLPPLPPYTDDFQTFLQASASVATSQSRKVNGLFAFSSIGVEGGFRHLPVPSNVAINGRVYHQLRNISQGQHPLRWLLYDQQEQDAQSRQLAVSAAYFDATRRLLEGVNPYIHGWHP